MVFPSTGLLDGNRIYDLLSEHLYDRHIEDTTIPFCCVATDLETGGPVCLEQGLLSDAVRASISIPGIFTPFVHSGRHLGDGGIVNPVPVDVARRLGVDVVLAVNLNHPAPLDEADEETSVVAVPPTATARRPSTCSGWRSDGMTWMTRTKKPALTQPHRPPAMSRSIQPRRLRPAITARKPKIP